MMTSLQDYQPDDLVKAFYDFKGIYSLVQESVTSISVDTVTCGRVGEGTLATGHIRDSLIRVNFSVLRKKMPDYLFRHLTNNH